MTMAENAVWAMMAGGLAALALMALADTMVTRGIGALRNLLLITSISLTAVLLSGLPETLYPGLPHGLLLPLKVGLGPLSCALGLHFLGLWLGGGREDRILHRMTSWGCYAMLIGGLVLMVLATQVAPGAQAETLLILSAQLSEVMVVLTMIVAVRATVLGDPLARWLVVACVLLAGMITGLYLRALNVDGVTLGWRIFTAACTVLFVLIVMVLIIVRNRDNRRLARLARLDSGSDPATGLATGSRLLSEVEHVFWRTGRLRGKCVVVCLYLGNLYALGEALGRTGENQILAATAARIRRAVGFRCLVGMYHPRCFVVVIATERRRVVDDTLLSRLRTLVGQPMLLQGDGERRRQFLPQLGLAMKTVLPDQVQPQALINEVEHEAMDQLRRQPDAPPADAADTTW